MEAYQETQERMDVEPSSEEIDDPKKSRRAPNRAHSPYSAPASTNSGTESIFKTNAPSLAASRNYFQRTKNETKKVFKLLLLLGLLVGALYTLHLLAQDYQKITAAGRFLLAPFSGDFSFLKPKLFKRDVHALDDYQIPKVRWKQILQHDGMKCARSLFCQIGQVDEREYNHMERVFSFMISMKPVEDFGSYQYFKEAFETGRNSTGHYDCRFKYPTCPFSLRMLLKVIDYLVINPVY